MRAVALIPARGGSKRLPRKNIVDFRGKPIIAYTIAAAKECGRFERIVVSTEDNDIAKVAERFGAEVEMRDPALATDVTTVDAVCLDFLEREKAAGRDWTHMACLYATAPLRTADDINGVMTLLGPDCHFAMGVSAYEVQPHIAHKLMEDKRLIPMWPELVEFRASDLPPLRASNGTSYGVECAAFRKYRTFYGPDLRGYDMPRERAIDIDTADDLDYALWLAGCRQKS
jgi:N-acylneuraminate cytidylyltransferase